MADKPTGIEVQVIDWKNGSREVAIYFRDFNQMLTLNPEGARRMAFILMECADYLEPPFAEPGEINPNDDSESVSLFGPYEAEDDDDEEDDDE